MKTRFKDRWLQDCYATMLTLAADKSSELYWKGEPRRGSGARCAFWDGYSGQYTLTGPTRSANVIPRTLTHACFAAGQDFRRSCG